VRSFWGVYGYGVVPGAVYQRTIDLLMLAAAAGLLLLAGRALLARRVGAEAWAALLMSAWLGATVVALLSFMRTARYGIHGRLLFPAAAAIGLLLVLGWASLAPSAWRARLLAAVPLVAAGLALWQGLFLAGAYALPATIAGPPANDRPLAARFAGGVELLGLDLPEGNVATAGQPFPLRLTLRASQPVTGFARLFVHLNDVSDASYGRWDGVPAGGRHPTGQWRPGQAFQDEVRLDVPAVDAGRVVTLSVGFYDPETGARWPLLGADGRPAGDRAVAGHVWVQPAGSPPPSVQEGSVAAWENGIVLESAEVVRDAGGAPRSLVLSWSTRRPVNQDLTVFAQVLDSSGRLLAQVDRRPLGGAWPTDAWPPGATVEDTYVFDGPVGDWDSVILGWYGPDQVRVPLEGGGGDHLVVARR
jgi:hypothetical protein